MFIYCYLLLSLCHYDPFFSRIKVASNVIFWRSNGYFVSIVLHNPMANHGQHLPHSISISAMATLLPTMVTFSGLLDPGGRFADANESVHYFHHIDADSCHGHVEQVPLLEKISKSVHQFDKSGNMLLLALTTCSISKNTPPKR